MQAEQWKHESGVIATLINEPWRFELVQAVQVLLVWLRRQGVDYDQAFSGVLRFQNSLSLGFAPSQIESLRIDAGARRVTLTPAFIGLLGTSGVLPFHYTERIAVALHESKDESARAFMDIFSQRMAALYCQGWEKYRLPRQQDSPYGDQLLPRVLALGGVARAVPGLPLDAGARYAALLRTRPVAAGNVGRILSEYFSVPIRLEQFVGAWDAISPGCRFMLGGPNARLGYGAALGPRQWREDLGVCLHIGPLDERQFDVFLPRGAAALALEKMLGLLAVPPLRYQVRLLLGPSCIAPWVLSGQPQGRRRLGLDMFLAARPHHIARPELRYLLNPSQ